MGNIYFKNQISVSDEEVLSYYIEKGIIGIGDVMNSGKEVIMKTILDSVHKYAIRRTKDGRYTTYVSDPGKPGGRRQIRKKSGSELYRYLLEHYGLQEDDNGSMSFA